MNTKPASLGMLAFFLLLALYFSLLTLVSGWQFTASQFAKFGYYIVPLSAGFGLQVAFLWVGLAFNVADIAYIGNRLRKAT